MSAATRSVRLSGISPRSVLLTVGVIALILALFFIPEIIKFQKSLLGVSDSESALVPTERTGLSLLDSATSPLKSLSALLDRGYLDQLRARKVVEKGDDLASAGGIRLPQLGSKKTSVGWKGIKSKESKAILKNAAGTATSIAASLPVDRTQARYALSNFTQGVNWVLAGKAEKSMMVDEAVRYLEYLHTGVTQSLIADNVDQRTTNRWMAVSLGPVVGAMSGGRLSGSQVVFNPEINITKIVASQGAKPWRARELSPLKVRLRGTMVGYDIDSIEVWGGGVKKTKLSVRKPDSLGHRVFSSGAIEARGPLTLRVKDKYGRLFEKTYLFYPRIKAFPWKRDWYKVPEVASTDVRLDRFFAVSMTGSSFGSAGGDPFDDRSNVEEF